MYEAEYEYIQFGTIENININNINDLPISSKITIIPSPLIPIIIDTIVNTNTNNNNNNNNNNLTHTQYNCFIKKTYNFIFNIIMSCLCMVIMINVYYALL